MAKPLLIITREKHLDHLVRVIPFIVLLYAIQSYMLIRLAPAGFTSEHVVFLGAGLFCTISAFIIYNLKHRTEFFEHHLIISFMGHERSIAYHDLVEVMVQPGEDTFSTLTLVEKSGKKYRIFLVDDAAKIKQWLESQKASLAQAA